jgi:tetratricopeptide (TPR) repeat protein
MMHRFPPSCRSLLLLAAFSLTACATADTESLKKGFKLYSDQHPDQSEAIADRFIAASPDAAEIDQAYYLRGISRMTRGNLSAAIPDLKTAISKTMRDDLHAKAHNALIKAYTTLGDQAYDLQRWPDALKNYQTVLDNYAPDAATSEYANYRIGAVLQAQGDWIRAKPWFTKVINSHIDAALTDRARHRVGVSAFSLQFGAFQDLATAQSLAAQIRAAGIAAAVISDLHPDNKPLYLVQSGNFLTFAQATTARDRVLSRFPLTVIVP